jgi:hypothetical protein
LVRKGHAAEGQDAVGAAEDELVEAVGAADGENSARHGSRGIAAEIPGKIFAVGGIACGVEADQSIAAADPREKRLPLLGRPFGGSRRPRFGRFMHVEALEAELAADLPGPVEVARAKLAFRAGL